jgi:hypothetical protein
MTSIAAHTDTGSCMTAALLRSPAELRRQPSHACFSALGMQRSRASAIGPRSQKDIACNISDIRHLGLYSRPGQSVLSQTRSPSYLGSQRLLGPSKLLVADQRTLEKEDCAWSVAPIGRGIVRAQNQPSSLRIWPPRSLSRHELVESERMTKDRRGNSHSTS